MPRKTDHKLGLYYNYYRFFFYICIMFYLRLTYLKISAVPQWSVAAKLFFIFSWLELR